MTNSVNQHYVQGKNYNLYNQELISNFVPEMLTPTYWQAQNAITGTAQGRGTTWFIKYFAEVNETSTTRDDEQPAQHWVLRHYYRGGLIGKLINDSYLFTGIKNTRAMREFALLEQLQHWQLPAPKPIACNVVRHGLFGLCYRANLLSSRIENAQDLVAILSKEAINDELWLQIGATIKRFHDHDIYHHDLNAHNILINSQQEVYLIDFDRGESRNTDKKGNEDHWKESNMSRLKRSFYKELHQLADFNFTDNHWQILLSGYTDNQTDN